jgi:2-haloacid dehalogenase
MLSSIKAIIFDFGNVLLEWDPRHVYQRYFPNDPDGIERFLNEVNFADWNLQQDKGRTFAEGIAVLSRQFPHYSHLIQAYHDDWIHSVTGAINGTVNILKRLKQAGYPLYGLSNWSAETFPRARAKYDFFDLFDGIVLSGDVGLVKPDPQIYQIMLRKIGRPAEECLFIDDSLTNIQQAQTMGFITIHFQSPEQLENALRDLKLLSDLPM